MLDNIFRYISELEDDQKHGIKYNFIHGELCESMVTLFKENREVDENNMILPVFVYYDDYECGNPLGSRKGVHKLGGVYVLLPFLPPEFRSNLQNIFLLEIFVGKDRKLYGNEAVF